MDKKYSLNEEQLDIVTGGSNYINRNNLESKINQTVKFVSRSEGVEANVRIINVIANCHEFYSHYDVRVYALDESSYNKLNSVRLDSQIIRLWDCDGIIPADCGLGYGDKGFRLVFEDGDEVYFYDI